MLSLHNWHFAFAPARIFARHLKPNEFCISRVLSDRTDFEIFHKDHVPSFGSARLANDAFASWNAEGGVDPLIVQLCWTFSEWTTHLLQDNVNRLYAAESITIVSLMLLT